MTLDKTHLIVFIAGAVFGLLSGFFIGKGIYDQPITESVTRDTVTRIDTVFQYYPKPVEVEKVRTEYKWLTRVKTNTDTLLVRDSVLVEVPVESKHYHAAEYDAYVSGYMPSLDSIKVYQRTEYITETITNTIKETKHFFLDVGGGCEYLPNTNAMVPFAELGFKFKKGRVGAGVYGGYAHDLKENKAEPLVKAKVTYDLFSF